MTRRTAYLVHRTAWNHSLWYNNEQQRAHVRRSHSLQGLGAEDDLGPRTAPAAVYFSQAAALAAAARLEAEARDGRNPLWFGFDFDSATSLSGAELAARAAALGLAPPPPDHDFVRRTIAWQSWWDEQSPGWTPDQRAAAWGLFDKVRFYEVAEIPFED